MERVTSSSSPLDHQHQQPPPSNYDEVLMKQGLMFSDTLQDLKNLRKQLYSAAEYFEASYGKDNQKLLVVESLKDYVIKALINTVDHLGSMTHKVNCFFDEKIDEVFTTQLRFSCVEQRVRTCQKFIDQGGFSQQSLAMSTPIYHKRYILPAVESTRAFSEIESKHQSYNKFDEVDLRQPKKAVRETSMKAPRSKPSSSFLRLPSPQSYSVPDTFTFTKILSSKQPENRSSSPLRFPLIRSGSLVGFLTSPNASNTRPRYPSEPRRTISLHPHHAKRNQAREVESHTSKSKRIFKALLSMRKPKKDDTYRYLDEN